MPAPMMAPMPSAVRSTGPSVRLRRPGDSSSAVASAIAFLRVSCASILQPLLACFVAIACAPVSNSAMAETLERRLGVFSATTLIVGSMIGSGIFIAPSIMAGLVATPGVYLGLWLIGGALTLLGALAYGELCAMMPKAGGQYVFLREAFGPQVGFLYGWTVFLVIQTGFNAAVAIAFSKFLGGVGLHLGENDVIFKLGFYTLSRAQVVAVAVIAVLTWVNCRGVEAGAFVQNLFTVLKVGAIALLVLIGFASGKGSFANFSPLVGAELGPAAMGMTFLAAIGVAMSKALFAYD